MKRFIQGEHPGQSTLLPESLDDYVSDTNSTRVVDVIVDELDLVNLGFKGAIPVDTGRPEKIAKLKTQMKELQAIETQLNESPDKQDSLTGPDACSMMTRGIGIVGSDRDQLSSMAKQAREVMASDTLSVVADRGYFKSDEILACHDVGITAYVPKPMNSGLKADGRFNNNSFPYNAAKNEYICPAGEALIWRFSSVEKCLKLHHYWSSNCQECLLKSECTPSKQR